MTKQDRNLSYLASGIFIAVATAGWHFSMKPGPPIPIPPPRPQPTPVVAPAPIVLEMPAPPPQVSTPTKPPVVTPILAEKLPPPRSYLGGGSAAEELSPSPDPAPSPAPQPPPVTKASVALKKEASPKAKVIQSKPMAVGNSTTGQDLPSFVITNLDPELIKALSLRREAVVILRQEGGRLVMITGLSSAKPQATLIPEDLQLLEPFAQGRGTPIEDMDYLRSCAAHLLADPWNCQLLLCFSRRIDAQIYSHQKSEQKPGRPLPANHITYGSLQLQADGHHRFIPAVP